MISESSDSGAHAMPVWDLTGELARVIAGRQRQKLEYQQFCGRILPTTYKENNRRPQLYLHMFLLSFWQWVCHCNVPVPSRLSPST